MSSPLSSNSSDYFNLRAAFGASITSDTQKRPLSSTSTSFTRRWNPEAPVHASNDEREDRREKTIIPVNEVLFRDATMYKNAVSLDAEELPIEIFSQNYPEIFQKWRPIWEMLNAKGWHFIIHAGNLYCTSANATHLIALDRNYDVNDEGSLTYHT